MILLRSQAKQTSSYCNLVGANGSLDDQTINKAKYLVNWGIQSLQMWNEFVLYDQVSKRSDYQSIDLKVSQRNSALIALCYR